MSILLLNLHVKGLKEMYDNKGRFVNRYYCMEDFYKKFIVTQDCLNQAGLLSIGDRKNISIKVYHHIDCLSAIYTIAGEKTYDFIECYKFDIFLVELTETWISVLQVIVKNITLYEDLNDMKTLDNIAVNNSVNASKSLTIVSCLFEGCENSYVTDIKTFDIDTIGMNLAISIIMPNFIYQDISLKRFAEFVVASMCPLNMDTYVCLVTCIAPVIRKILHDKCSNNAEQELVSEYHWDRIVTLTVIDKTFMLWYCISSLAKMTENEKETLNTECQQLSYALYFGNLPERDDQMKIIHCIMEFAPMMKEEKHYDLQDYEINGIVERSTSETISDLIRNCFVMYTTLSGADNKNPRVDSENDKYRCQASDGLIYHNDAKEEHISTNKITDCQNLLFSDLSDLVKDYCEFIASDNNCVEVECRCKGEGCLECCNVVDTDNLETFERENTENDK